MVNQGSLQIKFNQFVAVGLCLDFFRNKAIGNDRVRFRTPDVLKKSKIRKPHFISANYLIIQLSQLIDI